MCPNLPSDLVGIISPFCLLSGVKHRHPVSLQVLWALQNKIAPEISDIVCMYKVFPHFHGWGREGTGGRRVERKVRRHCGQVPWLHLAVLGNPGDQEGANGTCPQPLDQLGTQEPSGHAQALLSLSANPLPHPGTESEARPSPTRWH